MGRHRRIADPSQFSFLDAGQHLQVYSTIGVIGLLLSQVPFFINIIHSFKRGKLAGRNPWQATTLEWEAPSPPGHGNFDVPPVVHRDPYEFSHPEAGERDWLPQTAES